MMNGMKYYNKREYLSISSLTDFARCPRRFFYKSGCRLKDGEDHPALIFGTAMHKALPVALTTGYRESIEAFETVWTPEIEENKADDKRSLLRAKMMLADFHQSHEGSNGIYKLLEPPGGAVEIDDSTSDYEVPFAIDIGLDVPLVGRVDGLCRHRDTKELYALEFKTSQEISSRFFECFDLSPQVVGYTLALQTLAEETIRGTIVEALRVSKTERTETLAQPLRVEPHHLDDFVTWAHFVGSQILHCEEKGEFPKAFSGCSPYPSFGTPGFTCEFKRLCQVEDWVSLADTYEVGDNRPFKMPTIKGKEVN